MKTLKMTLVILFGISLLLLSDYILGKIFENYSNWLINKFYELNFPLTLIVLVLGIGIINFIAFLITKPSTSEAGEDHSFAPIFLTNDYPKKSKKDITSTEEDLRRIRYSLCLNKLHVVINYMKDYRKTTLATDYLAKYKDKYFCVLWINIDVNLEKSLISNTSLIQRLNIKLNDSEDLFTQVLNALNNLPAPIPNLLILNYANQYITPDYDKVSLSSNWHILVSYGEHQSFYPNRIELDFVFETHKTKLKRLSKSLFYSRIPRRYNKSEIYALFERTIDHFDGLNEEEKLVPLFTFKYFEEPMDSFPENKISKIKSYVLNSFSIRDINKDEEYLLMNFIGLPNEWFEEKFLEILINSKNSKKFYSSLKNLCHKGFIQKSQNFYRINPVIIETLRSVFRPCASELKNLIKSISTLLNLDEFNDNIIDKSQFIPYAEYILDILKDDSNSPEISILYNNLAIVYKNSGKMEKARWLLEKALSISINAFGNGHPTVESIRSNLAVVYYLSGSSDIACKLLRKVLTYDLKNFGKDHPTVATTRSNLGVVYLDLGRSERAFKMLKKALASDLKNFGKAHPRFATRLSNFAGVHLSLGNLNYARNLLEDALASDLNNFGKDHFRTLIRQANFSLLYRSLGKRRKGYRLCKYVYFKLLDIYGHNNPYTILVEENFYSYKKIEQPNLFIN